MNYKLVPMDKSHLSQVAAIERECFSHPWSEVLLEQELYNDMISLVVAEGEDGTVLGYGEVRAVLDEGVLLLRDALACAAGALCEGDPARRQTAEEAAPLLLQGRIELDYTCPDASLLIPGDPGLLRYMVLELIANSARAVGQGQVHLQLKAQGSRVLLTVSDSGAPLSRRQLASLIQQDSDQNIPSAGAGAGLGLSVVRRVVALHRGTMLVEWGDGAPVTLISLPAGPLNPRATVSTSGLQRDGGLSPLLTALADVLPVRVFELAELY